MNRRILYIHQNYVGPDQPGNARVGAQLAALREAGFEIDVIASQQGYLERQSRSCQDEVLTLPGLRVHRLAPKRSRVGYQNRGRSYLDFLQRSFTYIPSLPEPSVIFVSSPPLPQMVSGLLLSALYRVPLVLEVRDLWPAFMEETGLLRSRPLILAMRWLEAISLRYAAQIVAVTPGFAGLMQLQGVAHERICVIPSGATPLDIPDEPRRMQRANWRNRHRLANDQFVALYAGSLNEHYAVDALLDAAKHLERKKRRDITIAIYGDGRMADLLREASNSLSNVLFLGAIPNREMREPLTGADLALVTLRPYPLFQSVFPGKLFEAMAAGLPVLSNIRGHTETLLRASGGGWFAPASDGAALADQLEALADLPRGELQRRGHAGQSFLRHKFNAQSLARALPPWIAQATAPGGVGRLLWALLAGAFDVLAGRNAVYRRMPDELRSQILDHHLQAWLATSPDQWLEKTCNHESRGNLSPA